VALTLAASGLYGLVVYAVAQRTKEIGIRLALGASGGRMIARFALQAIVLAALGAAVGVVGAVLFIAVLRRFTPDAQPLDPWTIAGVVLLLGAASVVASVVPARRAAQVDPLLTLRAE
jgi:ABC-type antimicrobial peptide transport system permease subunit